MIFFYCFELAFWPRLISLVDSASALGCRIGFSIVSAIELGGIFIAKTLLAYFFWNVYNKIQLGGGDN